MAFPCGSAKVKHVKGQAAAAATSNATSLYIALLFFSSKSQRDFTYKPATSLTVEKCLRIKAKEFKSLQIPAPTIIIVCVELLRTRKDLLKLHLFFFLYYIIISVYFSLDPESACVHVRTW